MDRAEHVRQILSARGLTLYRVSQQSAEAFGRSSRFYVPHNLRYDIANPAAVPTIHQMLALSHITNYALSDWLAVFGIDLDVIFGLRVLIQRRQTTLLDSSVYDTRAWIPWFMERQPAGVVQSISPLGQLLAHSEPRRALDLLAPNKGRFLYGLIGEADVYALPTFVPGSIVRADTRRSHGPLPESKSTAEKPFFLVEHEFGCSCSRLLWLGKDRVALYSPQDPCVLRELQLGKEARVLGLVDAEIRPIRNDRDSGSIMDPAILENSRLVPTANLRDLLRNSRIKVGLCFREASSLSHWVADALSDELYFAAPSTLSDYETLAAPPRHIQKILTLCLLYCIDFREFLRASGLPLNREGHDAMPDELALRQVPNDKRRPHLASEQENAPAYSGFSSALLEQWGEIPLFLRHSLEGLTGLKNFSSSDVFWVGRETHPLHPWLINATMVAVNRRVKKPSVSRKSPLCKRPLYLILRRDGSYLCGPCILRHGHLIVDSYPGGPSVSQQLRNRIDAEVVGQVTTILRRLAGPSESKTPFNLEAF